MQRQRLYFEVEAAKAGVECLPTEVLDWTVAVACANHDVQNALKWSLSCYADSGNVARRLFITIAS
eukprot:11147896-Lingulodinium_polyedra.AAC.1